MAANIVCQARTLTPVLGTCMRPCADGAMQAPRGNICARAIASVCERQRHHANGAARAYLGRLCARAIASTRKRRRQRVRDKVHMQTLLRRPPTPASACGQEHLCARGHARVDDVAPPYNNLCTRAVRLRGVCFEKSREIWLLLVMT